MTHTGAGGGDADKLTYESEMTLPYDDAQQPITAGEVIAIRVERNPADTYSGEAIAARFELCVTANSFPSEIG